VANICTLDLAVKLLILYMEKTDGIRLLYSRLAYFYLTSVATLAGIRDRAKSSRGSLWFD